MCDKEGYKHSPVHTHYYLGRVSQDQESSRGSHHGTRRVSPATQHLGQDGNGGT